jgi:hypothetical protein
VTQLSQLLPPPPVPTTDLWIEPSLRNNQLPPPSYDDSVADLPPDYTYTDALATAHSPEYTPFSSLNASLCSDVPNCLRQSRDTSPASSVFLDEKSLYASIDFGFTDDGVRSHAKKKKNAPKKAQTTSNAFEEPSPSEDPPPPPEEPPPPADGGGSGGGDGGDGGDGDKEKEKDKDKADDDWGADWGDVSTKKKKKSKKQAQEEEEAERLKKEEEEAAAAKAAEEEAERLKKEEEDAAAAAAAAAEAEKAAAATAPDLSWANDTRATDDWGFGATTSKKKKKKGKVRRIRPLYL